MSQFQLPIRVFIEDTDAGGIVYYVNYLKYMERARTEWLRQLGFDFAGLQQQGCLFVVKHADVNYVSPAKMDELLQVGVSIVKMARTYIRFHQLVSRDGAALCEADIKVGCINTHTMRPTKIPDELQQAFQAMFPDSGSETTHNQFEKSSKL